MPVALDKLLIDKPHYQKIWAIQANFFCLGQADFPAHRLQAGKRNTQSVKMSMITAAQWVPRGFAAPFPKKYTLDESEFERIAELAKLQLDDAEEDLKEAQEEEGSGEEKEKAGNDESMEVEEEKETSELKLVLSIFKSQRLVN